MNRLTCLPLYRLVAAQNTAAYPPFEVRLMLSKPTEFLHIVEENDRVLVRFPENTALSEANAEELSQQLTALAGRPHLVVDLGSVTMLTSVVLAKFIALNGRVRAAGGRLTLFNPNPTIRKVFQVTRLDTILDVKALSA